MPDWAHTQYKKSFELGEYLASLSVQRTKDEFGQFRYFVTDCEGDWISEAHDTAEEAFADIERMRGE